MMSGKLSCSGFMPHASMQRDMLMDMMKCSHRESHSMIEVCLSLGRRGLFKENLMFLLMPFYYDPPVKS